MNKITHRGDKLPVVFFALVLFQLLTLSSQARDKSAASGMAEVGGGGRLYYETAGI